MRWDDENLFNHPIFYSTAAKDIISNIFWLFTHIWHMLYLVHKGSNSSWGCIVIILVLKYIKKISMDGALWWKLLVVSLRLSMIKPYKFYTCLVVPLKKTRLLQYYQVNSRVSLWCHMRKDDKEHDWWKNLSVI